MYNKKSNKCYTFENIARNNITLGNLKKERDFDYTEILDKAKVKFLGYYNDCWNFKRYSSNSYPTILSFGKYKDGKSNNDMNRGELYNIAMMYMAGEIVANERFRHVTIPIMFFDIVFKDIKKLNNDIATHITGINENDEFYVLVSENYFKTTTLNNYLDKHAQNMTLNEWRVLMFQIIYALAKFHNRFAGFRHNKLDLDSILVVIRRPEEKFNMYTYGNTIFKIPNAGFDIKLSNFKYSYTSDYIKNTDATGTKDNPYYDIHYFLQHIMFKKQAGMVMPQDVVTFVNSLLPSKYVENDASKFIGLDENKFDSNSSEIVVPSMIIRKNKFFSEFITDMADLSASPVELRRINIEKLKHTNSETRADLSITDASSDAPRLLGRKVSSKRKKSNAYYKNDMKGLRKIVVPNFSEGSNTHSESDTRKKVSEESTNQESGYESEIKRLQGELRKKFESDSQSGGDSETADIELGDTDSDSENDNTNRLLKSIKTLEQLSKSSRKKKSNKMDLSHSSSHSTSASRSHSTSHSTSASRSHSTSASRSHGRSHGRKLSKADENIYSKYIDSATRKAIDNLPEGYVGEVPEHIRQRLPFDNGMGGMGPSMVDQGPPMGNVPPPGMMAQMAANMGNVPMGNVPMGNVPMGNVPMGNVPMGNMPYMNEGISLDTAQPHDEGYMGQYMPMNEPAYPYMQQMGIPQMGAPQMGMQQMGAPQMGMQQMGAPQMGIPQMGAPQMGIPQMGIPQMGAQQMGGSHKYKIVGGKDTEKNTDQKKKDFFF
jgi:hypothetical protein